jgi:hypothetical protein
MVDARPAADVSKKNPKEQETKNRKGPPRPTGVARASLS